MDWEKKYVTSRAVTLEVSPQGLIASNSVSRGLMHIELAGVFVLLAFKQPATPREALVELQESAEFDEGEYAELVGELIRTNLLLPVDAQTGTQTKASVNVGFASVKIHHGMLKDASRVYAYRSAISRHAAGKVVAEIGCGSGILSIFAAQAGAKKVYPIEESVIAQVAQEMFAANQVADRIQIMQGNSRDVELPEKADLLIHEIIGESPFDENMLDYVEDARRRLLKEGGRLLPFRIQAWCVGLHTDEDPNALRSRAVSEAEDYGRAYGVNVEPVTKALQGMPAVSFLGEGRSTYRIDTDELELITDHQLLYDIDLRGTAKDDGLPRTFQLTADRSGQLGAAVIYFRTQLDEDLWLTNSPNSPLTSWGRIATRFGRRVPVQAGDKVSLTTQLVTELGKQRLSLKLTS